MNLTRPLTRIQTKLLLSYLLVTAASIGGLVIGIQLLGPSLFDRMLVQHAEHHPGMMGTGMSEPMRQMSGDAFREAMFDAVLISTVLATIVALLISMFVSNRITSPVRQLAAGSHRIAAGDYGARVQHDETDEIGELATTFNWMAAQLEDTEKRRVQLIGDVAHELRTPLSTLQGNIEGLQDGVIEPSTDLLAQLHGETLRLSRLVDDLQELSRVEAGQVPLRFHNVNPAYLVETAITRMTPQFSEKGVEIRQDFSAQLPDVVTDHDRALQVLTNLLANALRYTPPGGSVEVSARAERGVILIQIEDTGAGIPAEHLPHIFDRFYRVDRARSRELGGSGIGLSIAKALVEAQGGQIWADSPGPGQGATFSFTLPVAGSV